MDWKTQAYYWRMKYESMCSDLSKPERTAVQALSDAEDAAGYKVWSSVQSTTDDWPDHVEAVAQMLAGHAQKS